MKEYMCPYLADGEHRRQPVLSIFSHASMALGQNIRLRVCGMGGRVGAFNA
nr:hypothetical protein [Synechococcus sp. MU1611]